MIKTTTQDTILFVRDREIKAQESYIEDLEIELRSLTVNDDNHLSKRERLKDSIAIEKVKLKSMKKGNKKYNKLFKRGINV